MIELYETHCGHIEEKTCKSIWVLVRIHQISDCSLLLILPGDENRWVSVLLKKITQTFIVSLKTLEKSCDFKSFNEKLKTTPHCLQNKRTPSHDTGAHQKGEAKWKFCLFICLFVCLPLGVRNYLEK